MFSLRKVSRKQFRDQKNIFKGTKKLKKEKHYANQSGLGPGQDTMYNVFTYFLFTRERKKVKHCTCKSNGLGPGQDTMYNVLLTNSIELTK